MARPTKQKAELLDYARAHPDESGRSIAKRFGVSAKTVRRWFKGAGLRQGVEKQPPAPPELPARAKQRSNRQRRTRTPAAKLAPDKRLEAIAIVTRCRAAATRYLDDMDARYAAWKARADVIDAMEDDEERRKARKANPIPKIARDESLALLNMQKLAAQVIDSHPGLLELDAAGDGKAGDREARRGRVRAALGLKGDDDG